MHRDPVPATPQSSFARALGSLLWIVRRINEAVLITVFAMLCTVLFAQVIARFVAHAPFSWSEELARYFQVWLVILGAAATMQRGQHIVIDFLTHQMPDTLRHLTAIVVNSIMVAYLVIVLWQVPQLMQASGAQVSPAMQIPMSWVYLSLPIGGSLLLIETTIALVRRLMGREPFDFVVREEVS